MVELMLKEEDKIFCFNKMQINEKNNYNSLLNEKNKKVYSSTRKFLKMGLSTGIEHKYDNEQKEQELKKLEKLLYINQNPTTIKNNKISPEIEVLKRKLKERKNKNNHYKNLTLTNNQLDSIKNENYYNISSNQNTINKADFVYAQLNSKEDKFEEINDQNINRCKTNINVKVDKNKLYDGRIPSIQSDILNIDKNINTDFLDNLLNGNINKEKNIFTQKYKYNTLMSDSNIYFNPIKSTNNINDLNNNLNTNNTSNLNFNTSNMFPANNEIINPYKPIKFNSNVASLIFSSRKKNFNYDRINPIKIIDNSRNRPIHHESDKQLIMPKILSTKSPSSRSSNKHVIQSKISSNSSLTDFNFQKEKGSSTNTLIIKEEQGQNVIQKNNQSQPKHFYHHKKYFSLNPVELAIKSPFDNPNNVPSNAIDFQFLTLSNRKNKNSSSSSSIKFNSLNNSKIKIDINQISEVCTETINNGKLIRNKLIPLANHEYYNNEKNEKIEKNEKKEMKAVKKNKVVKKRHSVMNLVERDKLKLNVKNKVTNKKSNLEDLEIGMFKKKRIPKIILTDHDELYNRKNNFNIAIKKNKN